MIFMRFVVSSLLQLFTMKDTKLLKEAPSHSLGAIINAYPFFTVLAHGIARLFMPFVVSLTALCPEGLKYHPIVKLDSLITSPAASASSGSFVNGHRVRDGRDGPSIVHYRKLNDVQPDLFVSVADSGPSTCRAVSEVPDEIYQLAVRVNRGGGIEQNAFPENGRVVGEPATGNGRSVLNMDDEFSCIGLSGAIQNRQSYDVFP